MRKILSIGLAVMLFGIFSLSQGEVCSAKVRFVTIGTCGVTGVYLPIGGSIGRIVNKKKDIYNLRVTCESTACSVFNINALLAGDQDFGIAQSDPHYQAWHGLTYWKDKGPQKELRSICSFHPETVFLIAADDTGIEKFMDLKGKEVSIGAPGTGMRGNAIELLEAFGLDWQKDIKAKSFKLDMAGKMLQDDRVDAVIYTTGHPNAAIKEATIGTRKIHFIPLKGPQVDKLVSKWPYYAKGVVPIKFYPRARNKEDVPAFGVKATLVTTAKMDDDVVYAITKELFDNLEYFKTLHPAFGVLTKENMLDALTAPIHAGAMKYYKEVGMK